MLDLEGRPGVKDSFLRCLDSTWPLKGRHTARVRPFLCGYIPDM